MSSGLEELGGVESGLQLENSEEAPRLINKLVKNFRGLYESIVLEAEFELNRDDLKIVNGLKNRLRSLVMVGVVANSKYEEKALNFRTYLSIGRYWDEYAKFVFEEKLNWKKGIPTLGEIDLLMRRVKKV